MNKSFLAALFLITACTNATFAAGTLSPTRTKPKATILKNETESFLGIDLSSPFPGTMPACPKASFGPDWEAMKDRTEPCFEENAPGEFTVWKGPDLGLGHSLNVKTFQGYPHEFVLLVGKARFPLMMDTFSTRYGPPQISDVEPIHTGVGGKYSSRLLIWRGRYIRIRLDEIGNDIRWSRAVVTNLRTEARLQLEHEHAAEAGAGKL